MFDGCVAFSFSVSRRKLIDYGYIHAVKIGTTLKIPKISVINYVMEKEVKKVG